MSRSRPSTMGIEISRSIRSSVDPWPARATARKTRIIMGYLLSWRVWRKYFAPASVPSCRTPGRVCLGWAASVTTVRPRTVDYPGYCLYPVKDLGMLVPLFTGFGFPLSFRTHSVKLGR